MGASLAYPGKVKANRGELMANDFLHQRHADEGSKLHGIVMGAAASGIAFALHETTDRPLTGSLAVILSAVVAWSLSFVAGVINRRKVMQTLKSNLLRNEAQSRGDQAAYDIAVEFIEKHKRTAHFCQEAQLWTLLAGAILYVGGHVWHLAETQPLKQSMDKDHAVLAPAKPNVEPKVNRPNPNLPGPAPSVGTRRN